MAIVCLGILIAVTPFDIKSHTAISLKKLFLVENVNLFGFVSLALSLHLKDGELFFNGKKLGKKEKKEGEKPNNSLPMLGLLKDFNFVNFEVRGAFGNASDAASTALISSSIIMIIKLIKNTMLHDLRHFEVKILPIYQKNILDLEVKFKVRVNIFLIIILFLRILKKR